ncbi:MAG: choice-of-anchor J domain-containing protein [Crocinitomicaceae bacterium]|nr:choice-of-anchor J domain-containing protein [Crocinitomicaceae bacterium]
MNENYKLFKKVRPFSKVKLLFTVLFSLAFAFTNAQTIQLGSGTGTTSYFPLYYNYDFNYSQTIYTAAEVVAGGADALPGTITKIRYKPKSTVSTSNWVDWVVYMGNTSKEGFANTTDWVPLAQLDEVFNGQITSNVTADQWFEITLDTPFNWDGVSNIVVAVDENTGAYGGFTSWSGYTLAPSTGNKGIYRYVDNTDIDPSSPGTATSISNTVAQIQFFGTLTACPWIITPSLTGLTSNSVDVSWVAGGTETSWNVEWGTPGFTPGTGNELGSTTVSATNTSISGLTAETNYQVYIQADCGSETSSWTGPLSFTTLQVSVGIPYTDDFSSANWVLGNGTQTNKWFIGSAAGNPADGLFVTNDAGVTNAYSTGNATVVHASKLFTLPATTNTFNVAFDWKSQGESNYDYVRVWVVPATATLTPGTQISTGNTPGALQLGVNHQVQSSWQTANYEIPASFAGSDVKIVFEWRNDNGGGTQPPAAIDNFSLTEILCPNPTALTLDAITSNSADISWTAGGSETSWNVEWGTSGFAPGTGAEIGSSVASAASETISGLTPETSYQVYIQADCAGDGTSTWFGPFNITTTPLCPAVTALTLDAITSTSAAISWTAGATETSWNVEWGTPGFTPGTGAEIASSTASATNETISGLTAETNYQVYVQADCAGDGTSTWVGPLNVYTGYCIPTGAANNTDEIRKFTLNDLSNTSTASEGTNGYSNYSTTVAPATLTVGDSYVASLTSGSGFGSHGATIWIDYNDNLIFEESERVASLNAVTASSTVNFPSFTVSNSLGQHRLRVGYVFNVSGTLINPCSTSTTYSEYEDYSVLVIELPVSPTITEAANPTCATGAILSTTGTPGADEAWYWQTTATGTDMSNDATNDWAVFTNGDYYVRAYNTAYGVWGDATSITVSDMPVANDPTGLVAAANPACVSTQISVDAADAGQTNYWQGANSNGVDQSEDASTPYDVTASGTYYVRAYDATSQCWSNSVAITVQIDTAIPDAPTADPAVYNACVGVASQMIEASAFESPSPEVVTLATNYNWSAASATLSGSLNLPVGALITSANIVFTNLTSSSAYLSDLGFSTSGVVNSAYSTLGGSTFPTNTTVTRPVNVTGNGAFTVTLQNDWTLATTTVGSITLVVNYSTPLPINWYDAPTAGNNVGTGSPLEAIGTTVMPDANTAGSYEFYAESVSGGCVSTTRTLVTVNVDAVNVDLLAVDVSCNNGNDGSFLLDNVYCGNNPATFTYSVDGGAFGAIPTDLFAGSHTVQVKDANGDLSAVYTIVIVSAAGPSDLDVTSYTNDEVTIVWNGNGSETSYNVEWGTPGFVPGTGAAVGTAVVTDTTYTIQGLDGSTEYDIYVSTNCGGPDADWAMTDVETDCDPIAALGYCEDFEDITALGCWKVLDVNGDGDRWNVYTGYANSGTQSLGIYTDYNAGNNDDYIVLPRMTLTGNEVLTFKYRARSTTEPNNFEVVMSTNGFMPADFTTTLLADTTVSNTTYKSKSIDLSQYAGDVYIAFHVPNGGLDGYYLYIDDVCINICTPVSGTDGSANVCRLDNTIDLNSVITSPYTTGEWVFPANQSVINGSIMNVSTMANGAYQIFYIVEGECTSDTTVATINVFNPSSAGENGLITTCKNTPINLYGGLSGNVDFGGTWYRPDGTPMASANLTTGTLVGQQVYRYIVSNGVCGADTADVTVNVQSCDYTGLDDLSMLENITVAPNPNTGNFQILGIPGVDFTFEVLDLNGRLVRNATKITSTITDVNLTDVEDGVYMVRIKGNNSERMIRVIKQK